MIRILLLAIPVAMIFLGFGAPFLLDGGFGRARALALIVAGSALLAWIEIRTRHRLERRGWLNRILDTDA